MRVGCQYERTACEPNDPNLVTSRDLGVCHTKCIRPAWKRLVPMRRTSDRNYKTMDIYMLYK